MATEHRPLWPTWFFVLGVAHSPFQVLEVWLSENLSGWKPVKSYSWILWAVLLFLLEPYLGMPSYKVVPFVVFLIGSETLFWNLRGTRR